MAVGQPKVANAVYWIGEDGNVWSRARGKGVVNHGSYALQKEFSNTGLPSVIDAYQLIDDPVAAANAAAAPTGSVAPGGGGGGAAAPVFNQAGATNTQLAIDQVPGLLADALAAENTRYQNTLGGFNAQEASQRDTHDKSTITNQQNYDANFMDSIRSGVKGLGGLFQILRGTGAGGGSVEDDARDIVGGVTARDIRTGADTQQENQTALNAALSTFLTDLRGKREANEDTFANNQSAIRRDSNTQLQDLYSKMAGFYGDAGRTAEYNDWMGRAGGLTPEIAKDSRTQVSNYDTTPVAVQTPQLSAFAAPSQPNVVSAPSDGQIGSGIFTMSDRRRRETAPAGV